MRAVRGPQSLEQDRTSGRERGNSDHSSYALPPIAPWGSPRAGLEGMVELSSGTAFHPAHEGAATGNMHSGLARCWETDPWQDPRGNKRETQIEFLTL